MRFTSWVSLGEYDLDHSLLVSSVDYGQIFQSTIKSERAFTSLVTLARFNFVDNDPDQRSSKSRVWWELKCYTCNLLSCLLNFCSLWPARVACQLVFRPFALSLKLLLQNRRSVWEPACRLSYQITHPIQVKLNQCWSRHTAPYHMHSHFMSLTSLL